MLFIGDDWAEDHHDIELVDDDGRVLARRRFPEGIEGVAGLHALVAEHLPEDWDEAEPEDIRALVKLGIETDRGPWVAALAAAGYEVFAINPMSVARYRERHSTSGAKSDAADAHLLAEIVRLDRAHHRPLAGDSEEAEAIKLVARTHQSLIWDRGRHVLRLRAALRDFFPAALKAFPDLDAPDALELLAMAPDPDAAARLSRARIAAALRRAKGSDWNDAAGGLAKADDGDDGGLSPQGRGQGERDPADPARRGAAARTRRPGRLRRDSGQPGPHRADPEHPDRGDGGGGGRPFWATPGR